MKRTNSSKFETNYGARNIVHPSAFLKRIGIACSTVDKIVYGEAVQVNFRQFTSLCLDLNCRPNDLFALRQMQLPEFHDLHSIQMISAVNETINVKEWLAGKSVEEIKEFMRT